MATPAEPASRSVAGQAKELVGRGRARVERTIRGIEASRERVGPVDIALSTAERDRSAGGAILAGAVAYRAFLWMLPAALTVVLVLGIASTSTGSDPATVVERSGLPAFAATSVAAAAHQENRGRIAAIAAALVLLWFASAALLKVLRAVHVFAWRLDTRRTSGSVKSTAGFVLLAFGAVAVVSGISSLRRSRPGLGLGVLLLAVVFFAALWWFASWRLPHPDVPAVALLPGAVLMGAASQAMSLVNTLYLGPKLSKASELYGDLGSAAVLLLGLYILSRAVVAAAMLDAAMWTRHRPHAEFTRRG